MAAIDSCWAADILAGCLSPMTVLERRLKNPLPESISAAAAAIGKRPLRRVTGASAYGARLVPFSFHMTRRKSQYTLRLTGSVVPAMKSNTRLMQRCRERVPAIANRQSSSFSRVPESVGIL